MTVIGCYDNVVDAGSSVAALRGNGCRCSRERARGSVEHDAWWQRAGWNGERQGIGCVWIGKHVGNGQWRNRATVLTELSGHNAIGIKRRARGGRINNDRHIVLTIDGDGDRRGCHSTLAIADLIRERISGSLTNGQAVECTVWIVVVSAVGVHHQQRAGGERDGAASRVGHAVDL